jgi:hypothetical protein
MPYYIAAQVRSSGVETARPFDRKAAVLLNGDHDQQLDQHIALRRAPLLTTRPLGP